jgi:hypothetical protein
MSDEEGGLSSRVRRRRRERKKNVDEGGESGGSDEDEERQKKIERRRQRRKKKREKESVEGEEEEKDEEDEESSRAKRRRRRRAKREKEEGPDDEEGDEEEEKSESPKRKPKKKKKKKKQTNDDSDESGSEEVVDSNIAKKKTKVIEIERREFDPTQFDFEIDPEDVMEGSVLPVDQKNHFLRLNVPPPAVTITGTEDFALTREQQATATDERSRGGFVYVESATTGHFKRLRTSRLGYNLLSTGDADEGDEFENGPEVMTHFTDSVNAVTAAFYQFAQGLLAGLALLHVYVTQMFSDNETFVNVYWPFASETRRLFFILTTVAFAAAYDLYLRESSRKDLWQVLPIMQKLRVYVILFLYFLALLSSLFVMPIDNALSTLGKQGQSKAGALLVDAKIYEWNVHEVIRAVCCILAWTLVCIGIHEENQNGRRFMAHCKYLNNQIQQQKLRLDKVSGKQLQHATPEELDDLLAVQKSAQEATERAISYYRTRVR